MNPVLAIGGAVVVAVVIGSLWYSPLMFANIWLRLTFPGKRPEDISKENMSMMFLTASVGHGIVMIITHYIFSELLSITTTMAALQMALLLAALVAGSQLPHHAFCQTPLALILINSGYDTAVLVAGGPVMVMLANM